MIAALLALLLAAPSYGATVRDLQEAARKLMFQGRRREAIEKLSEAQALCKAEKEKDAILAKKKMFAEQFLLADSFEKFQSARSAEETANWSDCMTELESVGGGDQDNVRILLEKAKCSAMAAKPEASEKAYSLALEVFPESLDAQLGLVEEILSRKDALRAAPLLASIVAAKGLSKSAPKNSKESERITLARAKLLELQGNDPEALDLLRKDYEASYGSGDRAGVLLELGLEYDRQSQKGQAGDGPSGRSQDIENAWQARKYLSLFVKRCLPRDCPECSRCKEAQEILNRLDKKLNQP